MGLLRTLLAISVVAFHSGPILGLHMPDGVVAVQSFYVISGFYMAYVLSTTYANRPWAFYVNRFLRIFPIYWIVAAATLVGLLLTGSAFIENWKNVFLSNPAAGTWTALCNLILLGQDWNAFLYLDGDKRLAQFNFVNTAWTLGVELTFYAIAPWLLRFKSWVLVLVFIASAVARLLFYNAGYDYDPWNYRFFPFEIAFFIFGALGYRAYVLVEMRMPPIYIMTFGICAAAAAAFVIFGQHYVMGRNPVIWHFGNVGRWYSIAILGACAVFLFPLTNRWGWDRALGEFSYPIYICHMFFITFFSEQLSSSPIGYGLSTVIVAAAASWVLILATSRIDQLRSMVRVARPRYRQNLMPTVLIAQPPQST